MKKIISIAVSIIGFFVLLNLLGGLFLGTSYIYGLKYGGISINKQRISDIETIKKALSGYYKDNKRYPIRHNSEYREDYRVSLKELVPKYLSTIPDRPYRSGSGAFHDYYYDSSIDRQCYHISVELDRDYLTREIEQYSQNFLNNDDDCNASVDSGCFAKGVEYGIPGDDPMLDYVVCRGN